MPVPSCTYDHVEMERANDRSANADYEGILERSLIPDRCKNTVFGIPEDDVIVPHPDNPKEWKTMLEYSKFHYVMNNPRKFFGPKKEYPGIFVPGNPGTRKTSYVCEVAKHAMRMGHNVLYYQVAEIITNRIQIWPLIGPEVLILDDLGNDNIEKSHNLIWTLVNKRLEKRLFTAVVTNYSLEHNQGIFGEAFMDRMNLLYPIVMIGDSSRVTA